MKRISIFIGLKIAEIGGGSIIWWLLCMIGQPIDVWLCDMAQSDVLMPFWMCGVYSLIVVFICILFFIFIAGNWKYADKLAKK